jgi:putative inorganic carbon (HCO3(-)) transporter
MTTLARRPRQLGSMLALLLLSLLLALGAVGVATVGTQHPAAMLLAVAALVVAVSVSLRPELATAVVLFLVYANVAVVAVKFHGVPPAFAAVVPMILVIPAARNVFGTDQGLLIPPVTSWIALFVAVQLLGAMFAPRADVAFAKVAASIFEGAVLFMLVVNAVRTRTSLRRAVAALLAAGALMGGIVAYQQVTGTYDDDYGGFGQVTDAVYNSDKDADRGAGQPRLAGPIGEKNRYGQIMAMLVPIALFQLLSAASIRVRLFSGSTLLLISIGIAASLSRGAAVGLGAVLGLALVTGHLRLRHLVAIVPAILAAALIVPEYGARISSLKGSSAVLGNSVARRTGAVDSSVRGRATEMAAAVLMFSDHPLLGVGPGMYSHHYQRYARRAGGKIQFGGRQAHSLYLGLAAEHGLLGLFAFGGIVLVSLRGLYRARRYWMVRDPELAATVTGLLTALLVYMASSVFLHMAYVRYFWLILALATAASCLPSEGAEPRPRESRTPW